MSAQRKLSVVKSVQAEAKRSGKSSTARLQAKTLRGAHRHGMAWDDYEVSVLVNGIDKDETTFDMAMRLGRSYYSVMGARAHVRFGLDHIDVLARGTSKRKRGN